MENNVKRTQFRAWKSGKNWLYTSTALAVLGAGAAFGGQKAKADSVTDVQNQITLNSLAAAAPATETTVASTIPVSAVTKTAATNTVAPTATLTADTTTTSATSSDTSLTSSEASALSSVATQLSSALSANPTLSSGLEAITSAVATSSGSAVMASLTATLSSAMTNSPLASVMASGMSDVNIAASELSDAQSNLTDAVSSAASTSAMSQFISGINAISEDATTSSIVAAISSASAAGNTSLEASLVSYFYTETSQGSEVQALYNEFAQTAVGKTLADAASAVSDAAAAGVAAVTDIQNKAAATISFLGISGTLGDYLQSVVGATLGYAIGMFGGHLLSLPFGLIIAILGNIGVAPLNIIGLTIPGWFGGIGSGYLDGVGWGFTGYTFSTIGSTLGAWYGATNMFLGLDNKTATLTENGSALGAAIGGFIGGGIGAVIVTLLNHLWWLMIFPGAFLGVVPFAQFISVAIMFIGLPITAEGGMALIQGILGVIGAGIGALIGGGIGAIAQALGLNFDTPSFTSALGSVLNLTGLGSLITQIINQTPPATGSISVTNQTVANGTAFKPSSLLVSATDSNGSTVDLNTVTYTGTVIPTHSGTYAIQFSFTDSDGSTVTQTALWTVQAKGTASAANIAEAVVTNKTTDSESLKVTNTTLVVGQAYRAASAFVSATDSEGNAVPASAITVTGTVVSSKAGVYPVVYSFTDPYTGDVVSQTALVTVTPATKLVTA